MFVYVTKKLPSQHLNKDVNSFAKSIRKNGHIGGIFIHDDEKKSVEVFRTVSNSELTDDWKLDSIELGRLIKEDIEIRDKINKVHVKWI